MIYRNGKEIKGVVKHGRSITAVYKGGKCVFRAQPPISEDLKVFPQRLEFAPEGGVKEVNIITKGGWEII